MCKRTRIVSLPIGVNVAKIAPVRSSIMDCPVACSHAWLHSSAEVSCQLKGKRKWKFMHEEYSLVVCMIVQESCAKSHNNAEHAGGHPLNFIIARCSYQSCRRRQKCALWAAFALSAASRFSLSSHFKVSRFSSLTADVAQYHFIQSKLSNNIFATHEDTNQKKLREKSICL